MSKPIFEQYVDERGNISVRVSQDMIVLTQEEAERIEAEYKRMQADNHKLRELVRDLWEACPVDGYYCIHHCKHYDKESESHCKLIDRMRELGVEVDA